MKSRRILAVAALLLTIGLPAWASSLDENALPASNIESAEPAATGLFQWAMTPIEPGRGLEILAVSVLVVIAASRLRFKKQA